MRPPVLLWEVHRAERAGENWMGALHINNYFHVFIIAIVIVISSFQMKIEHYLSCGQWSVILLHFFCIYSAPILTAVKSFVLFFFYFFIYLFLPMSPGQGSPYFAFSFPLCGLGLPEGSLPSSLWEPVSGRQGGPAKLPSEDCSFY